MSVIVDITTSLDGFVTGPDPGPDRGLGVGGEVLHRWVMEARSPIDEQVLAESLAATGAVVMGRNTFDVVDGPHGWNDEMGFGAMRDGSPLPHNFVVTHREPASIRLKDQFTIITDGLGAAIERAVAEAGDRDVTVMGGGDVCRQVLDAGLADELRLHLAPVVLGAGQPLFDGSSPPATLEPIAVRHAPAATHLHYRVVR